MTTRKWSRATVTKRVNSVKMTPNRSETTVIKRVNSEGKLIQSIFPRGVSMSLVLAIFIGASLSLGQANELPPDHAARMAKGLELFKKEVRPLIETKCLRCHGGKDVE